MSVKACRARSGAAILFCYNGPVKSIFFDYGGTLDSDGTSWLERFYLICAECGIHAPRESFDRAFHDSDDGLPGRHALRGLDLEQTARLQALGVLEAVAPDRADLAETIARRFASESRRQFARLKPALEGLARRYRLGVVSNFYGNLDGLLSAEGLRACFSVVADSGALGVAKPDPAIFLYAAGALNARPEECVMVGDSVPRDIRGAASAGMKTALVCAGPSAPDAGQDWTVRSVAELAAALG